MKQNDKSAEEQNISLMIIGAQKAGTTSLKNYLGQHPSLKTHYHKEFAYFVDPNQYDNNFENARKKYFPGNLHADYLIAKNAGLYVNDAGIALLKAHNPNCKLVITLRNPVERTYSAFLMEKNYGMIDNPFESLEEVMKNKDMTDWRYEFLIGMSLYEYHLKNIYNYFPPEQIKLIRYEDLKANSTKICLDIFKWMGINDDFTPDTSKRFNETKLTRSARYGKFILRILGNHNPIKDFFRKILPGKMDYKVGEYLRNINLKSENYAPMSLEMRNLLIDFYAPFNDELSKLTGMDFSDWNEKK